jgi:hypothetical protein
MEGIFRGFLKRFGAAVNARMDRSVRGVAFMLRATDVRSTGTARLRLAADGNSASGQVQDTVEGRDSLILTRAH